MPFSAYYRTHSDIGLGVLDLIRPGKGGPHWLGSQSRSANIQHLLHVLGQTVADPHPDDFSPSSQGNPFERPWHDVVRRFNMMDGSTSTKSMPRCMLIDRDRLQQGMHMMPHARVPAGLNRINHAYPSSPSRRHPTPLDYAYVNLGSHKEGRIYIPNKLYLHRFVCAAINGPPDEESGLNEVVHMCRRADDSGHFGYRACLNPLHMVWGDSAANMLNT